MRPETMQIVELAKRGLTAEQIAPALGMTVEQVTAVILNDCSAVKEIQNCSLEDQFAGLEEAAMQGLKHLVKYADNEGVRLKAIDLVVRQRHGLLKPRERVTVTNNLNFLVERAERARQVRDRTMNVQASVVRSEKQVPCPNESVQLELVDEVPSGGAKSTEPESESEGFVDCVGPVVAELICA
jgi:hypothetical protein